LLLAVEALAFGRGSACFWPWKRLLFVMEALAFGRGSACSWSWKRLFLVVEALAFGRGSACEKAGDRCVLADFGKVRWKCFRTSKKTALLKSGIIQIWQFQGKCGGFKAFRHEKPHTSEKHSVRFEVMSEMVRLKLKKQ